MFAWLESASIDCARLIRGTDSIAKLVAPVCAIALIVSPAVSGARKPISTPLACSRSTSSALGGATLTTTSDSYTAPASSTIRASACSYCSSGIRAPAPAPRSTTTSRPSALSLPTTSGTNATRRSPSADSLGTPICTGAGGYRSCPPGASSLGAQPEGADHGGHNGQRAGGEPPPGRCHPTAGGRLADGPAVSAQMPRRML